MKRLSKRISTVIVAFAGVAILTAGFAAAAQPGGDAAGSYVRPLPPAFGGLTAQEPMGQSATPLFSATESSVEPHQSFKSFDGLHTKISPSGIQFEGSWFWEIWYSASTMDAQVWGDRVNNTNTYSTGTLKILLKAATNKANWGDSINGYNIYEYQLGQLGSQQYFQNIDSLRQAGTRPPDGTYWMTILLLEWDGSNWFYVDFLVNDVTTTIGSGVGAPCNQDLYGGVVCLRSGRFEFIGSWTDFSNPPVTRSLIWTPVENINATAGFQNNPSGIQIVMRVADGCSLTGTWWVWLGGFTDAGWDIRVRDTVTGRQRTFTKSRQGGVFPTTLRDSTTFTCN